MIYCYSVQDYVQPIILKQLTDWSNNLTGLETIRDTSRKLVVR